MLAFKLYFSTVETSLPVVTQCPEDVLSVTERLEAPTWTAPIFFGDPPYISTLSSGENITLSDSMMLTIKALRKT